MVRLVLLPRHEAAKPKEVAMSQRNMPRPAAVYGIDIGKNVFQVVGLGSDGVAVQKVRFRRDTLLQFFERAAPAIVGMESGFISTALADCVSSIRRWRLAGLPPFLPPEKVQKVLDACDRTTAMGHRDYAV
jgi:hypothetical protein